ncbi:hypothetical protein K438DRAFT_1725665 [Mycena galopus ATCC 62051]|nr:hypothetical protein K438DRAFT_1725665 [Mycena galopus ATCC 62051]
MSDEALLPDGSEWLLRVNYTSREDHGVSVLVVFSCFSLTAVVGLLLAISLSAFNTRSWSGEKRSHLFVRTHVAAYFISLLLSDLIQAIGSIMNVRWIRDTAVIVGNFCTLQGALKQAADVATAFWTLVIAIHTFSLICLGIKSSRITLVATLVAGWSGIAAVVIAGPTAQNTTRGPFFGISGYWCWISAEYPGSRIALDYLFMFIAATFSFILYTLIYFRLRGNIIFEGKNISFRRTVSAWRGVHDTQTLTIAKQMLLIQVAYTILILPIAAARFSSFAGQDVPFEVTIFTDAVFLLSGVVNVTVFTMTRRILPPDSFKVSTWTMSGTQSMPESSIETGTDSYYQAGGIDSYGPNEKCHASDAESTLSDSAEPSRTLAPPPWSNRGSGHSVYDMYAADSNIPLTPPADVARHAAPHRTGFECPE